MSDVQQLTQVGRELVDLSETGQLDNLEDRLTRINNAWEDLSSAAEQRMLTLPKYKAKLADFEKSVDQMNQWLEDMERETNKVHPKEEETDLVKNKIDVSFILLNFLWNIFSTQYRLSNKDNTLSNTMPLRNPLYFFQTDETDKVNSTYGIFHIFSVSRSFE